MVEGETSSMVESVVDVAASISALRADLTVAVALSSRRVAMAGETAEVSVGSA